MNWPLHYQLAACGAFIIAGAGICLAIEAISRVMAKRHAKRQAKLQPIFDPIVIRRLTK